MKCQVGRVLQFFWFSLPTGHNLMSCPHNDVHYCRCLSLLLNSSTYYLSLQHDHIYPCDGLRLKVYPMFTYPQYQQAPHLIEDCHMNCSAWYPESPSKKHSQRHSSPTLKSDCHARGRSQHSRISPHDYVAVGAIHVFVGPARIHGVVREVPMVARVSLAGYRGETILDTFIRPTHAVYDYRTAATSLSPEKLVNAPTFHEVQREVAAIIRDKILVGHRLWMFLSIMGLSHPAIKTRDLALFIPLRRKLKARKVVELNVLVEVYMGRNLKMMYEDSLEHARAAMDMFRSCEGLFESVIAEGSWPCNLPPTTYAQYYT